MGYNGTTWKTGDVITAEKLNNLEQGVENATTIIVEYEYDEKTETYTADAMFGDVRAAFEAGTNIFFHSTDGSDEYVTNNVVGVVTKVEYNISTDPKNPNANGDITAGSMSWSANVDVDNLPQTIEELDMCTLYST